MHVSIAHSDQRGSNARVDVAVVDSDRAGKGDGFVASDERNVDTLASSPRILTLSSIVAPS